MAGGQGRGNAGGALVVLGLLALLQVAMAVDYVVGGATQWTFPPDGTTTFYNNWAKKNTFKPGDNLVFEYGVGTHNVWQVTQADYSTCNSNATPIKQYASGKDSVALPAAGTFYYICGFLSHCSAGMLMEVTVGAGSAAPPPPPSPAPATPPPSSPPPPPKVPAPAPKATTPAPPPKATTPAPAPKATTTAPAPAPKTTSPAPSPTTAASTTPTVAPPAPAVNTPSHSAASTLQSGAGIVLAVVVVICGSLLW